VNLGNPRELTMLELAEIIRELCGADSPITFVARPQDDPTVRRPDISLATELLGWSPGVELREGLSQTIEWFKRQVDVPSVPV
jgi:dTDP-glucose 4,6-dehydratase